MAGPTRQEAGLQTLSERPPREASSNPSSLVSALIFILCVLNACTRSGPTASAPGPAELELASYQLVNAERSHGGVSPLLERDPELDEVARRFSRAMSEKGFFSHTSPSGETLSSRLRASGYQYLAAGENIARVSNVANPAAYAHHLLMDSPSHRHNILADTYDRIGVGVAVRGSTVWVTQTYVRRAR